MKITTLSVFVDDQRKALAFYTDVLGFELKDDMPLGEYSWLTVTAPGEPDGVQILLEPNDHPAVDPFRSTIAADGIPWTSFAVNDVEAEYERLTAAGVVFTQAPMNAGPVTVAVFDDTVGNLIQIAAMN